MRVAPRAAAAEPSVRPGSANSSVNIHIKAGRAGGRRLGLVPINYGSVLTSREARIVRSCRVGCAL